jgi:hypothetical protein
MSNSPGRVAKLQALIAPVIVRYYAIGHDPEDPEDEAVTQAWEVAEEAAQKILAASPRRAGEGEVCGDELYTGVLCELEAGHEGRCKMRGVAWIGRSFKSSQRAGEPTPETIEALKFYADPDTYFAIGMFGDAPCGPFLDDFENVGGEGNLEDFRPGKRARAALDAAREDKNGEV